jgi:S1-C subfamily serine protease
VARDVLNSPIHRDLKAEIPTDLPRIPSPGPTPSMRNRLLIPCLLTAVAVQGLAQTSASTRQDIPRLVASARGTVVLLKTFDRHGNALGLGSGFRISGGRFVTNAHVVAGASRVEIFDDGGALLGIARSADMLSTTVDLAILPAIGTSLPYLALAGAPPVVGEQVVVIGAPEGLTNTVSDGIVSAVRKIEARQLLQISAPISPGSSGGPVLNARGEVVGVSVSILREGQNLNFAVPVSDVMALVSSRPGQFEFPASREDVAPSSPRTGGSAPSSVTPPPMLSVGSKVVGQLTPDDQLPSGGYVDYYRLKGVKRGSVSIMVGSGDFNPFVAVFRFVDDTVATVASDENGDEGTKAKVLFTLSPGLVYIVAVGSTDEGHAKMGEYALHVAQAPAEEATPSYGGSASDGRWLTSSGTDDYYDEFDRTRITRTTYGTYLFWERATYRAPYTSKSGNTYNSTMTQYELSCRDLSFRLLSDAEYLKGELVGSSSNPTPWQTAMPETVAEVSGKVVCAYVKAHGI